MGNKITKEMKVEVTLDLIADLVRVHFDLPLHSPQVRAQAIHTKENDHIDGATIWFTEEYPSG